MVLLGRRLEDYIGGKGLWWGVRGKTRGPTLERYEPPGPLPLRNPAASVVRWVFGERGEGSLMGTTKACFEKLRFAQWTTTFLRLFLSWRGRWMGCLLLGEAFT